MSRRAVLRRQVEPLVRGFDDDAAHLHHGDPGSQAMTVTELGQCRSAQAQLQDPGRRLHEQQPGHHVLDVGQLQRIRARQTHRTLHPAAAEMQEADPILFGEGDGRLRIQGLLGRHRQRQQQLVHPLDEARRIVELAAFCQERLIEQEARPVIESGRFRSQLRDQRMLRVDLQDRLALGRLLAGLLQEPLEGAADVALARDQAGGGIREAIRRP